MAQHNLHWHLHRALQEEAEPLQGEGHYKEKEEEHHRELFPCQQHFHPYLQTVACILALLVSSASIAHSLSALQVFSHIQLFGYSNGLVSRTALTGRMPFVPLSVV